jgi:ribosome-binding protein aMBF1 (putative translation factor)
METAGSVTGGSEGSPRDARKSPRQRTLTLMRQDVIGCAFQGSNGCRIIALRYRALHRFPECHQRAMTSQSRPPIRRRLTGVSTVRAAERHLYRSARRSLRERFRVAQCRRVQPSVGDEIDRQLEVRARSPSIRHQPAHRPQRADLSQKSLAEQAGMSLNAAARYERGQLQPTLSKIIDVATVRDSAIGAGSALRRQAAKNSKARRIAIQYTPARLARQQVGNNCVAAAISVDWSKVGAVLQQFQTLIVGIVGFTGVMATIATNAWLSRPRTRQSDPSTNRAGRRSTRSSGSLSRISVRVPESRQLSIWAVDVHKG